MIITKEWIDCVAPKHGRTSCNDEDLGNATGGWNGFYDRNTGKKEIHFPRCNRCYLLSVLGEDTDTLEFEVEVGVSLTYRGER